jgi:zinc and cadmium transporter
MESSALFGFASVVLVSLASLVGVLVLTLRGSVVSKALLYLVSFSTGAILGTVFFHLLPEVMEHAGDPLTGSALILGGMLLAFCIEKFIHWHHCHRTEHDEHEHGGEHHHPLGSLILIGDGIHNFIDGMLIVTAYMVSVPAGIATTVAVILHEIPQELSDISLLLHSGFTRKRAILWNTVSACTAIAGAAVAFLFESRVEGIEFALLPIAAGNFLYIATTDLIPELHKETRLGKSVIQGLLLLAGIALMGGLAVGASPHAAVEAQQVEETNEEPAVRVHIMNPDGTEAEGSVQVQVRPR